MLAAARLLLIGLLIALGQSACPTGPGQVDHPRASFCTNAFGITSATFAADPDVRTFNGVEYMTFTTVDAELAIPILRIFVASRRQGEPWCNLERVTWDDASPFNDGTVQNEVSTFTIVNSTVLVYYSHYVKVGALVYNHTTFSLRVKAGVLQSDGVVVFAPEERNENLWVLWANPGSPDLPWALNPNSIGASSCLAFIEPSIYFTRDEDTYYLALGCAEAIAFDLIPLNWRVKIIEANNFLFLNHSVPRTVLQVGQTCATGTMGVQAPTLLRYDDQMILSASPVFNGTGAAEGRYAGCLFFAFEGNSFANGIASTPLGSLAYDRPHSGSCSFGAGSDLTQDAEVSSVVYSFFSNVTLDFYSVVEASWDEVVAGPTSTSSVPQISSAASTTSSTGAPASSTTATPTPTFTSLTTLATTASASISATASTEPTSTSSTTSSSDTSSTSSDSGGSSLSPGAIAGIAVGGFIFLALVVVVIVVLYIKWWKPRHSFSPYNIRL